MAYLRAYAELEEEEEWLATSPVLLMFVDTDASDKAFNSASLPGISS